MLIGIFVIKVQCAKYRKYYFSLNKFYKYLKTLNRNECWAFLYFLKHTLVIHFTAT